MLAYEYITRVITIHEKVPEDRGITFLTWDNQRLGFGIGALLLFLGIVFTLMFAEMVRRDRYGQ